MPLFESDGGMPTGMDGLLRIESEVKMCFAYAIGF
jgi:hypothetical protein